MNASDSATGPKILLLGGALIVLLSGCGATSTPAPLGRAPDVDKRSSSSAVARPRAARRGAVAVHVVRRGETLYSIAWRYGKDYRRIAQWNGIRAPYTIHPGQRLRLEQPAARSRNETPPARAAATPQRSRARSSSASSSTRSVRVARWKWPTRGKVIGRFGAAGGKGINIGGRAGQHIVAAAPGKVVYSGSGLRGYGKLIIIKHNNRFLSAYAHNRRLHVKEGDTVQLGQRIADMGRSDAKRVMLHFEIRRDGKPVDPARYLPG